jgi:hypothetical protein
VVEKNTMTLLCVIFVGIKALAMMKEEEVMMAIVNVALQKLPTHLCVRRVGIVNPQLMEIKNERLSD